MSFFSVFDKMARCFTVLAMYTWLTRSGSAETYLGQTRFMVPGLKAISFAKALSQCKDYNGLHSIKSTADHEELAELSRQEGNHSFWLNVHKVSLPHWTWVNGSSWVYYDLGNSDTRHCGSIDVNMEHVRITRCNKLWLGYICQRKGNVRCENLLAGEKQVHIGSACYRIFFEKLNWDEARWRCIIQGMDLAVIQSKQDENQLKQMLRTKFSLFHQWYFWIGLRKADWRTHPENAPISQHAVFWDRGEPKHHGACAVAYFNQDRTFKWKTTHCTSRHRVACQVKGVVPVPTKRMSQEISLGTDTVKEQWKDELEERMQLTSDSTIASLIHGNIQFTSKVLIAVFLTLARRTLTL